MAVTFNYFGFLIVLNYHMIALVDLNPDPNNLPELDPKDEFLVSDLQSIYDISANPSASNEPHINPSWLRDTKSTQSTSQVTAPREM